MTDRPDHAPAPLDGPALLPDPLTPDPMPLLVEWYTHAAGARVQPNPDAMALATADAEGTPSVRVVLAKRIDAARGFVEFFTNYRSRKSLDLAARPRAGGVFHWDAMERQARVEGVVTRTPDADNDAYFATRPWTRQIGAWSSEQSSPVSSRGALLEQVARTMKRFGLDPANPPPATASISIPRPPHWGGWRLWVRRVELWCGSAWRVHDRAEWVRDLREAGGEYRGGPWSATRLQP